MEMRQLTRPKVVRPLILLRFRFGSAALLGLGSTALGQTTARPSPADSLDTEYRKFDAVETFVRNSNAANYAISTPNGIDESSFVKIGAIDQWVTIRGEDRHDPVLLFLHGGPGDVTNPWSFAFFAPWQQHFTVVQWELAAYLRDHLGKKKNHHRRPFIRVRRGHRDGKGEARSLPCICGHGPGG
jgi:hypothetical protein